MNKQTVNLTSVPFFYKRFWPMAFALFFGVALSAQSFFQSYPEVGSWRNYQLDETSSGFEINAFGFTSFDLEIFQRANTDANGNLLSTTALDFPGGKPVYRLSDGNYLRKKVDEVTEQVVFERLNPSGVLLNTITFDYPAGDEASAGAVTQFADGDVFLTYYYGGQLDPSTLEQRTIVYAKVNPVTGAVAWEDSFLSVFNEFIAEPYLVEVAPDGSVFMAIQEQLPTSLDNFICKISPTGTLLWRNQVSTLERYPVQFAPTADGGVWFIYNQVFDWVEKWDADGNDVANVLLSPFFMADAVPGAIAPAANNGVMATGTVVPNGGSERVMFTAFVDADFDVPTINYLTDLPFLPSPIRAIWRAGGGYTVTGTFGESTAYFSNDETFLLTLNENGEFEETSGGDTDLELSLTIDPSNPNIYSTTSLTLTLNNTGGTEATGVKVEFKKPAGTVYEGGNEWTSSQGVFNPFGSEMWNVGSLPAGGSATLEVNYFMLTALPVTVYAQVSAANETDADSTPGNGVSPAANEDDEVVGNINGGGPTPCDITASVSNITCDDNGTPNDPDDDTFGYQLLVTNGTQTGTFGIFNGNIQGATGTYGVPIIYSGALIIAAPFNPNSFIVRDAADPTCFTTYSIFPPPSCSNGQLICPGDITLSSQAEVNAWPGCTIVEGDLKIEGNDITDLGPLNTLQKVRGALFFQNNTSLVSLSGMENVDSVEALILTDNPLLQSIGELGGLNQASIASIVIGRNNSLESINIFNSITFPNNIEIFENDNLTSIGGFSNAEIVEDKILISNHESLVEVTAFQNLVGIMDQLLLVQNTAITDLSGFGALVSIENELVIVDSEDLENLDDFASLTSVGTLVLLRNQSLEQINGLSSLTSVSQSLTIGDNPVLSHCCGVYPLLNSDGVAGSVIIENNPMFCASETEILDNCVPSGDIDLSISLAQPNATPAQWSGYNVVLTIENAGPLTATGVQVSFAKPAGVVYTGGNEFTASQGSFSTFGNEVWNVGSIPAGGSATLTVNYFLLASEAPVAYAQVSAANETDGDSTPDNGTPPSVNEDDEASTGGGGPPDLNPDLVLANLDIQNSPLEAGQILNYEFDISNQGDGPASGNFNVKAWISTDQTISPDDIQDGTVPTGNYGVGLTVSNVPGSSAIPAGLAAGQYFLILKVDADNQVSESNEGNNLILASFTVDGGADCSVSVAVFNVTCPPPTGDWQQIIFNYEITGTNTPGDWLAQFAFGLNQGGDPDFVFTGGGFPATGTGSTFVPIGETSVEQAFFIPSFNCGDIVTITCPAIGSIDLSLDMASTNPNPPIYTSTEITLTVSNAGPQTATGVVVDFPRPAGTVYTGGNEWAATQGTFKPFSSEKWMVGTIPAGGTATLTVNYFLLTANALTPYAQVLSASETDGDSTPGNGTCCTPDEDDEVTLMLNAFTGGGINAYGKLELTGRPVQLVAVNPNPVYHGEIKVFIDSREEGWFELEAYDLFGRRAFSQKVELREGRNDLLLDVSLLQSGTYHLNMPGQNWRNLPLRFVVARW